MMVDEGRRAPIKVGLAVAVASAMALSILSALLILTFVHLSRAVPNQPPRGPGRGGPGERWQERVVDLGQLVPLTVLLGVVSIIFVSVIAWWATRKANEPIERALQIQRTFVADASHELRTPLTTLTSRIQLAQRRLERGGDVSESLAELRKDAAAMNDVLNDLLVAAETAQSAVTNARADVADCVQDAFRVSEQTANQHQIELTRKVMPGLQVRADRAALTRALVALLDNAIRHSPPGGQVSVTAGPEASPVGKNLVAIRVTDQGEGIQVDDPERLFERFARVDTGRGRRGFGLGLALVRDIATRFGGTIEVEHTSSDGTVFLLTLPL